MILQKSALQATKIRRNSNYNLYLAEIIDDSAIPNDRIDWQASAPRS